MLESALHARDDGATSPFPRGNLVVHVHAFLRMTRQRSILTAAGLLMALAGVASAAQPPPVNVLVVFSNGRLLPANIEVDRGLNAASQLPGGPELRLFAEFLDAPAFGGQEYEASTATYLRSKYATRKLAAIVAGGGTALEFVLRYRDSLFPEVPVVHVGVDQSIFKARTSPLPANVAGIPVNYDFAGTLALALRLHPHAQRVLVVTGSTSWDRDREADIRAAVAELAVQVPVDYLAGLAQPDLLSRLARAATGSIVVTPGYFADGSGVATTPRASVEAMVAASAAPVYAPYASQMGSGVVGGRMPSYEQMGRATRAIVDQVVRGTPLASIPAAALIDAPPQLDWRALERWNVPEHLIPPDSILHYRQPTLWEAHRAQVAIALLVFLIQTGLIAALLIERRLRRRTAAALVDSERQRSLAMHAARLKPFVWGLHEKGSTGVAGSGSADSVETPGGHTEPLSKVLSTVYASDREPVDDAIRKALADDGELDIEYRSVGDDGSIRWFAARGRSAGTTGAIAITGVRMDITQRKEAELQAEADRAALRRLSRISTMGQLSAAIAHQLNQPLAAILGNAETVRRMLDREPASIDEMREIMDDIIAENNRASQVIRRVGDLYRREDGELAPVDLNELARETADLLRAEFVARHVTPTLRLAEGPRVVSGNRVQLQQLLLNLLINAADAMARSPVELRNIELSTRVEGHRVELRIRDYGPGIPAADLPRVFDPFWTTKEHGLGVGLAICKAIAGAHHGTLSAWNNAGGGATFCFNLPMSGESGKESRIAARAPG